MSVIMKFKLTLQRFVRPSGYFINFSPVFHIKYVNGHSISLKSGRWVCEISMRIISMKGDTKTVSLGVDWEEAVAILPEYDVTETRVNRIK
jgi:hypothetical protein